MLTDISILQIIILLCVILFSMTLHEAMHGYVAYFLGDDTAEREGRLTLNPIKHIDPFLTILLPLLLAVSGAPIFGGAKPVPFNPARLKYDEWGMALVAIAGPLTNLLIAFIAFGIYALQQGNSTGMTTEILHTIVIVNLGFFVFNIIPLPPLDGSRVLYVLAPDFFRRGMEQVERFGIIVVFIVILIAGPLLNNYMLTTVNFFLTLFSRIFSLA